MAIFLGFDRSEYPGDSVMKRLRTEAQIDFTGFYLAPAPSHGNAGWMGKRAFLLGLGYGFAPVYVGQQQPGAPGHPNPGSHTITAAQGTIDGRNAAELAAQANFPGASVIYLDIETGDQPVPGALSYYRAWVDSVIAHGFSPGVYCSHVVVAAYMSADNRAVPWIFQLAALGGTFAPPLPRKDPSHSSFSGAKVLQHAQNAKLNLGATVIKPVDLDTALMADPSTVNT